MAGLRRVSLPDRCSPTHLFSANPMQTSAPRFNGKLTKWNAERGFGFVVADHGASRGRPAARRQKEHAETNSMGAFLVAILLVAGLAWYGDTQYAGRKAALLAAPHIQSAPAERAIPAPRPPGFSCDGRKYCSQMTSCSEAKLFLKHCPGMEMDGDGDRIPCEEQWCSGAFGG